MILLINNSLNIANSPEKSKGISRTKSYDDPIADLDKQAFQLPEDKQLERRFEQALPLSTVALIYKKLCRNGNPGFR